MGTGPALYAGLISIAVSTVLSMPISAVLMAIRTGAFSDPGSWVQAASSDVNAFKEMVENTEGSGASEILWRFVDMLFSAAMLEEGLKFLTCRIAIRKKGMVRTWMDAVIAFACVGITFEFVENIAFGMNADLTEAIIWPLMPGHFVFGVIMGWFFGKYLVSGQKKYRVLSFVVPVLYHALTNTLVGYPYISIIIVFSYTAATILILILIIRWQKNGALNIPVKGAD